MVKRLLIDATHPEENRVVVMNGTRLEDFDVETSTKKQLKGNIYLAKVIRVEPSLQAAFVDFGGNRHGFLAFSEIHPDYYQIPIADREALLEEARKSIERNSEEKEPDAAGQAEDTPEPDATDDGPDDASAEETEAVDDDVSSDQVAEQGSPSDTDAVNSTEAETDAEADTSAEDDQDEVEDEISAERSLMRKAIAQRRYKIQEVIKRRQIILVQVVKEERGNKGAALTTYLSLAGRYCVLMPNSDRGGGVSRKITNQSDRKRLKGLLKDIDIPQGMAVILRTAGSERSKTEIKRDFDFLMRTWDGVRSLTLESNAPALVHEEGNLIKRAIRDIYSRDIDEVLVEGDEGYKLAKGFMKILTPSHAKKVQPYKDEIMPLFNRYQVEQQLDAMHSPSVSLKSGGSIVFGQTEALVAIDVNSGKATRERHIEETALRTNLEAADEIARQLRLRDLAGLVVIDFIDMEENRNNNAVERRLKEAMKNDRARIQTGRISMFGLLELSRQRLRPSLQETSFQTCPHCAGTGLIRSTESSALFTLRLIEEEGVRKRSSEITVTVNTAVALYLLNYKRDALAAIETRYGLKVFVQGDHALVAPDHRMERVRNAGDDSRDDDTPAADTSSRRDTGPQDDEDGEGGSRRRRRRRRRRGGGGSAEDADHRATADTAAEGESESSGASEDFNATGEDDEDRPKRKRSRRGRRGGRRNRRNEGDGAGQEAPSSDATSDDDTVTDAAPPPDEAPAAPASDSTPSDSTGAEDAPKPRRRRTRKSAKTEQDATPEATPEPDGETPAESAEEKPARKPRTRRKKADGDASKPKKANIVADALTAIATPDSKPSPDAEPAKSAEKPSAPVEATSGQVEDTPPAKPRKGWWQRMSGR